MDNREGRGVMLVLLIAVAILVVLPLFGMVVMMMMGMSGMLTAAQMPVMSGLMSVDALGFVWMLAALIAVIALAIVVLHATNRT